MGKNVFDLSGRVPREALGKRSAGNPHAAFDEVGDRDGRQPTRQLSTLLVGEVNERRMR